MNGFGVHVNKIKQSANKRIMQLKAITSPYWGPQKNREKAFYLALVQAKLTYGIAAWWNRTSTTDKERLERLHARAAHIIAGVPQGVSRDDILKEARLVSLEVATYKAIQYYLNAKQQGGKKWETAQILFPETHMAREYIDEVEKEFSELDREGCKFLAKDLQIAERVKFNTFPPDSLNKRATMEERRNSSNKRVQKLERADWQIWNDGSVNLDVSSGAAALLYKGDKLEHKCVKGAGKLACSFTSESVALEIGLKELHKQFKEWTRKRWRIAVFTDSQSLLSALSTGPTKMKENILQRI